MCYVLCLASIKKKCILKHLEIAQAVLLFLSSTQFFFKPV